MTLRFDSVAVNIGQHYDAKNSIFVCPYDGYYMFMVIIFSTEIRADLMLEGSSILRTYISNTKSQATLVAVTLCKANQSVSVETMGVNSNVKQHTLLAGAKATSFSGCVLRAV